MGLKNTREILSIFAYIVICVSTVIALASSVFSVTFASQGFLSKHLATTKIVEECNNQLSSKYATLEAESGIPSRVFETVVKDYSTRDNLNLAASYVFTEESSELYSVERTNYFYNLCVEYLKGNNISYNEEDVMRVADKAAKIYSDTVGIHNTEEIKAHINEFSKNCASAVSISIVAMIVSFVMLFIMYRKKRYASSYFAGGIAGGSLATVVGSLLCLIFGVGKQLEILPEIYQSGVLSMIRIYFGYLILDGFVVMGIACIVPYIISKQSNEQYRRRVTLIDAISSKTNKRFNSKKETENKTE